MDRLLSRFFRRQPRVAAEYEPLNRDDISHEDDQIDNGVKNGGGKNEFSWLVYAIFLLLGIAMLWAWNMFLAAAPYFQKRFQTDDWILVHFQSAIMSVSAVTNFVSMLVLTKLHRTASYPKRIISSLLINTACFTLLALSTVVFRHAAASAYFAFLMVMVFAASLATGLCQNGVFAYVSGFGRTEYTQAIMTGQAIAGVLPCIAQIVSVLAVPPSSATSQGSPVIVAAAALVEEGQPQSSSKSAFAYFLTATTISTTALIAFLFLLGRSRNRSLRVIGGYGGIPREVGAGVENAAVAEEQGNDDKTPVVAVSMHNLFKKLYWLALAVFTCFAVTMVGPVFTQQIHSVRPPDKSARIFHPEVFIPLAFLFWNTGDLVGRLLTLLPNTLGSRRPYMLFLIAVTRILFIPLYLLCNIQLPPSHSHRHHPDETPSSSSSSAPSPSPIINSDLFYLLVVQFGFGLSNGWLGSSCMMAATTFAATDLHDDDHPTTTTITTTNTTATTTTVQEKEAAGGFMGLMLVAGLTVGSLASFAVARV